jgi:hypothetical protein
VQSATKIQGIKTQGTEKDFSYMIFCYATTLVNGTITSTTRFQSHWQKKNLQW